MGPLGSKGGPCRTWVEPGGCPGLGSCRAVECVRQWSPQPAVENIIHVWQGPRLCASPENPCHRHNVSDPCGTASPDPCPASVLVCLARLTSAVAVRSCMWLGMAMRPLLQGQAATASSLWISISQDIRQAINHRHHLVVMRWQNTHACSLNRRTEAIRSNGGILFRQKNSYLS